MAFKAFKAFNAFNAFKAFRAKKVHPTIDPVYLSSTSILEEILKIEDDIASLLHEDWRKGVAAAYVKSGKSAYEPRMRAISSGELVNINVSWSALHPEYKEDNVSAARAAITAYLHHPAFGDLDLAASRVHMDWMKRTKKEEYNAHQFVDFDSLSTEEKDKDRAHVRLARESVSALIREICNVNLKISEDLAIALYKNALVQ